MARSTRSNGKRQRRNARKNTSIYSPLNPEKKEIRILNISPGLSKGRLVCWFEIVSLLATPLPFYEAASWCWGTPDRKRDIIINGRLTTIPSTAYKTIKSMCYDQYHDYIWIDAVCINQADLEERGQQVAMMADVYSSATRTLVWLGESRKSTKRAIREVNTILEWGHTIAGPQETFSEIFYDSDSTSRPPVKQLPSVDWDALRELYSSHWFSRLWVCQEVILSKEAICCCGSYWVSWSDLAMAAQCMVYGRYYDNAIRIAGVHLIQKAYGFFQYSDNMGWRSLLVTGIGLQATVPQDYVYGFLGLAQLCNPPVDVSGALKPDYAKDLDHVYAVATRASIDLTSHIALFVLEYCITSLLVDDLKDWPSWVPRYDLDSDKDRSAFVRPHGIGAANGHLPNYVNDGETDGVDSLILRVAGVVLDEIHSAAATIDAEMIKDPKIMSQEILEIRNIAREHAIDEQHLAETLVSSPGHSQRLIKSAYDEFVAQCQHESGDTHLEGDARLYCQRFRQCSGYRRFFTTLQGRIGTAPSNSAVGDRVCVLFGSQLPWILRPCGESWKLVGTAYVHGIMGGEAIRELEEQDQLEAATQMFAIC